jgi:uncharacterized protein (TIGR03086 family)
VEPIEQLDTTVATLGDLVKGVRPEQLDNPTPCGKWAVRDLVGHLAGGLTSAASALRDGTPVDASPRPELLGDDPGAAFAAVADDLDGAIRGPGAMDRALELPFGEIPAPVFLQFLAFDLMVHSWDLATATGQKYAPADDLVAAADAFARQGVAPEMRDGDTFAAEMDPPVDATPLERLVAFSGRRPRGGTR